MTTNPPSLNAASDKNPYGTRSRYEEPTVTTTDGSSETETRTMSPERAALWDITDRAQRLRRWGGNGHTCDYRKLIDAICDLGAKGLADGLNALVAPRTPHADAEVPQSRSAPLRPEGISAETMTLWGHLHRCCNEVVQAMMDDPRLNAKGTDIYEPVGGERALVELAAEFDAALKGSPQSGGAPSLPEVTGAGEVVVPRAVALNIVRILTGSKAWDAQQVLAYFEAALKAKRS